uniref:Secreted protein n=1 Tax=Mesocestoides corti TaxID=53468 RepID=A0A5K3FXC2_MESCO
MGLGWVVGVTEGVPGQVRHLTCRQHRGCVSGRVTIVRAVGIIYISIASPTLLKSKHYSCNARQFFTISLCLMTRKE